MSVLITRQGALYQRKLEAIDQVWSAVKEIEEDPEKFLNSEYPNKLLKTVLPSRSEYIDNNDDSVHHYLLELKNIQDGKEADRDNAHRAAEITKEVESITNETAKIQADA